jgi:DNA invertase Pin-like site-specific DNA recombinase
MSDRAVLYLRQSLDRSGEALAVDRQRRDCKKLAKARGLRVVAEYVDNDVSASSRKPRPAYNRMLADVEAGAVDVVLCWHLDRLTRKLSDLEHLIELAERTGVKVMTYTGDVDLGTDSGRLVGRILASVARGEVERKSARQVAAARQRADRGIPSRSAYGYTADGLAVVKSEAKVIKALYARVLAGESLVSITRWLNDTGVQGPRGGAWHRVSVRGVLMRPRYAGIATYRGQEVGPGTWPPIVDEATLRAAQALLADPRRRLNKVGSARKYLGTGLYRCGQCEVPVRTTGATATSVYWCGHKGCPTRTVRFTDEYVEQVLAERLRRPDVAGLLARDEADRAEPLRAKAATLRLRLEQVTDDYAAGLLDGAQLHRASDRIRADLDDVEVELAAIGRATGLGPVLAAPDPAAAFLAAPLGVRRAVLDTLAVVRLRRGRPAVFDHDTIDFDWKV